MDLIHEQVCHGKFGVGTVVDQNATIITVQFLEPYGIKKFLYPAAFERHLEFENLNTKEKLADEMRQIKDMMESERHKRVAEEEKRQKEENLAQLEGKRAAAKKRSLAKKVLTKQKKNPVVIAAPHTNNEL